jgi:hypothetical protein
MRQVEHRHRWIFIAFIPQYFTTGAAYQFDWSYDGGVECVLKIAHPEKRERKNIEVWEEAHALQRSMPAPCACAAWRVPGGKPDGVEP